MASSLANGISKVSIEGPCSGADCPNTAGPLVCPTCQKQGLAPSRWCSQDCLKRNWATHKLVHKFKSKGDPNAPTYDPFEGFAYTGTLRPVYPRPARPKAKILEHIPLPDYAVNAKGISLSERSAYAQRSIKVMNAEEIQGMRVVCRLAREVLDLAAAAVKPGVTTQDLDDIVHQACMERDAYPSPLGYMGFPKSVCTSVNEVICHGIPDQRALQEGDIVNLDVSLYHKGFHADLNGTYPVGKIDADSQRLIDTTRDCLQAAINMCKPEALYRNIGKTIEPVAKANGCTVNRRYTGHGVRELFHCAPTIPHYAGNKTPYAMKPGHTFTIEPMICLGRQDEVHWPDNWTAVTADGKRSAQFEETLLITESGVEILTGGGNSPFTAPAP